ncbi:MAG: hypothetical protein J0H08_08190 [Rhizobiales bacterium]|jgi:hypothetical protein|nr:hypothetical protein [Hyphomicrobiales bacterium]
MRFRSVAVAVALWLGASGAAFACQGATILFQDSFERLQPTWGPESDAFRVVDGQVEVTPPADSYYWVANSANLYDDIDMCVTMTTAASGDPVEAKAGLIFWYADVNNFYVFELAPNGMASVWRRQRGKWLEQVAWREAEGANKGDGAINELRVTTVGNDATFYINGKQFEQLDGSAPENGQQVGLFAASPPASAARFAFDNLKLTKP